MAVVNYYVDTTKITGDAVQKLQSMSNVGSEIVHMFITFEVLATDSATSTYRLFKELDPNLIPIEICIGCDALTSGTSYSLGLYRTGTAGAVINAACFMLNQTLASAVASLNPKTAIDGMSAVNIASYGNKLYEHAGHTVKTRLTGYDLVLTANTPSTAAGTISVAAKFLQG